MSNYLMEKYQYLEERNAFYGWRMPHSTLYIQKWRVPSPIPATLDISIRFKGEYEPQEIITQDDFSKFPKYRDKPVIEFVNRVSEHTHTIRFDADGIHRPFNTIYLPKYLIKNIEQNRLQVIIDWC